MTRAYAGFHWEVVAFSKIKVIRKYYDRGLRFCMEKIDPCAIAGFHDIDTLFLARIRIYRRKSVTQILIFFIFILKGL